MASKYHRAQILLEPEQHRELTEIARRQNRSVSDVVREVVGERLERERQDANAERTRQTENWARIEKLREAILRRRGGKPLEWDLVEEVNTMREERDAEILRNVGLGD